MNDLEKTLQANDIITRSREIRKAVSARQKDAIERQVTHNDLTIDQKIELAKSRPGNSQREIERLQKLKGKKNGKK